MSLKGIAPHRFELIERLQSYHESCEVGQHLLMLHSICNIDKHRYLNVVNLHTFAGAYLKDDSVPDDLLSGVTGGLALLTQLKGTGYADRVEIDVITDVCFRDEELEKASPGYGSRIEQKGVQRPPVTRALSFCLMAVNEVVMQLNQDSYNRLSAV